MVTAAGASARQSANRPDADGEALSYIVVMEGAPVVAYEGDEAGYEATKPGKGGKINPNSAHVRKYEKFLESKHNASLEASGAGVEAKVHDYTIALNGYSAILTEEEAKAIGAQPGVVKVLEDEMRQPTTDSSPTFLGLNVESGAWDKGYDGEGVVVGIIDSGIWPEHASFADDGSYGATTSCSAPARCWTLTVPSSAQSHLSMTQPATTTVTAHTPPRRLPVTPASPPAFTASIGASSPVSPLGPTWSLTRDLATWADLLRIWRQLSTRLCSTAWT
jgi:subtilisin family serine protease